MICFHVYWEEGGEEDNVWSGDAEEAAAQWVDKQLKTGDGDLQRGLHEATIRVRCEGEEWKYRVEIEYEPVARINEL